MSDDVLRSLARFDAGELSEDDLRRMHPNESLDNILDLHRDLSALVAEDPAVPQWRDVVGRLEDQPSFNLRKRIAAVAVGLVVLVPAAAEAVEAIAPDQVRGTIVDRITDVLPWDRDLPESDSPITDQAPSTDTAPPTDEAPNVDLPQITDQPAESDETTPVDTVPITGDQSNVDGVVADQATSTGEQPVTDQAGNDGDSAPNSAQDDPPSESTEGSSDEEPAQTPLPGDEPDSDTPSD